MLPRDTRDNYYRAYGKAAWLMENEQEIYSSQEGDGSKVEVCETEVTIEFGPNDEEVEVPAIDITINGGPYETTIILARHQVQYLRNYLDAFLEATK